MDSRRFRVTEATIAELRAALDAGIVTSVELLTSYLNRIAFYDRHGIRLNSVPVLNPASFEEARAADRRRSRGQVLSPLDGIPYVAKDSYAVKGLTVASGSPAFEHLVATDDAFVIAQLRAAGAILIGLTNMPPMAAGGMQRGLYGRAESPYNENFLPAAYASGSSQGSATATAASFAAFGLAEETWSSGRAPASNGGLAAYTPSRGVISMRGNWPLIPTMDVVVPYARRMDDLLEILNVIVADDANRRGDFWRVQNAVPIPKSSEIRPCAYNALRDERALEGKRIGVPRMYINRDPQSKAPIVTRPAVIELWEKAASNLKALGAEVVEVDFPVVENYERNGPGIKSMAERGLVPTEFARAEEDLWIFGWNDFLQANRDPTLHSLADVDGQLIVPRTPGVIPDRYEGIPPISGMPERARPGVLSPDQIPYLAEGLRGLEEARRLDLEGWMDANRLDAVVFPAVADVAPADSDYNPRSSDIAWRNGTWVANGNQCIRHLGIPTVTVPMGVMTDIRMPVGLTFAGRAYDDNNLLRYAYAFEQSASRRVTPPRTPALPDEEFEIAVDEGTAAGGRVVIPPSARSIDGPQLALQTSVSPVADDGTVTITVTGSVSADAGIDRISVFVNGESVAVEKIGNRFKAEKILPLRIHYVMHSRWQRPYGSLVTVIAGDMTGSLAGTFTIVGGVG
jgi:amidase